MGEVLRLTSKMRKIEIIIKLIKQRIIVSLGIISLIGSVGLLSSFVVNPNMFKGIGWFMLLIISMGCFIYREERLNKLIEELTSKNSKAKKK